MGLICVPLGSGPPMEGAGPPHLHNPTLADIRGSTGLQGYTDIQLD